MFESLILQTSFGQFLLNQSNYLNCLFGVRGFSDIFLLIATSFVLVPALSSSFARISIIALVNRIRSRIRVNIGGLTGDSNCVWMLRVIIADVSCV